MNFMEAVQEMKKGKIGTCSQWYYKFDGHYLHTHRDRECENMVVEQALTLPELESDDWEVVDEEKEWKLSDNHSESQTGDFYDIDVKKCRDLIVKDLKELGLSKYMLSEEIFDKINERFGDLK